jgi:hypothetical protein
LEDGKTVPQRQKPGVTEFSRRPFAPDYSRTGKGLTPLARERAFTHTGIASSGMGFEVKNFRV